MIIGYVTDTHLRSETPEGRIDNFNNSILTKMEEVGQIFREEKCDIILHGGDWGDRPDIPYSVYNELVGALKAWNKPIYGIIGSHDYYGYQIKSLKRTAVGALYKSGIIELVGSEGMKEYIELDDICICGTPHTYWLDEDSKNYYKENYSSKIQIQLTHGMLLEKPAIFQHTLLTNIETKSQYLLGAHYHPGWSQLFFNLKGTTFIHPGGLARLDNTGKVRIPKAVIINSVTQEVYSKELQTAIVHPFKEKVTDSKEEITMNLVKRALDYLKDTQVSVIDIKQQLPLIANKFKYNSEIVDLAFNLIEEAEKEK
jgi:predicted phosphodiesterase